MQGFTRIIYDNGYKYIMVYPPGWKQGDPRRPEVHKERCMPGPSRTRTAKNYIFEPRAYPERGDATGSRQPVDARSSTGQELSLEGVQRAQKTAWSHPLKAYLAKAWMPKYVLGAQIDMSVRYEWPFLWALVRAPRTRKLYLVQRILNFDLRDAVNFLKETLGDVQLTSVLAEQGKLADLTLPDIVCCSPDEQDTLFIDRCRFHAPSDVTKLVQTYPLRTVIKAIKLFLHVPDEHEVCKLLRFDNVNHLCPIRNTGLFDLIALPGYGNRPDDLTLLIVCVTPWDVQCEDLEEFARSGVPDGNLDLISSVTPFPADILWAVIWDICVKHNCHYFILTTYDEWVFGTLSVDMHRARVTTHLRAPVFPKDKSVSSRDISQPCFPVPNVFECLLLWILAAADGDHTWWPLPPDLPAPVNPSELSVFDGGWKNLDSLDSLKL